MVRLCLRWLGGRPGGQGTIVQSPHLGKRRSARQLGRLEQLGQGERRTVGRGLCGPGAESDGVPQKCAEGHTEGILRPLEGVREIVVRRLPQA